ncbi:MAG: response regulator transcription factor [Anaerolineae bacterium]|jgi:two-component system NarL family response regulator|nr:response regulator transcription factor [Anaerolineae bacterium]
MSELRVLVVDDHALFREGIVGILSSQPDIRVVGEASDGLEALVMARDLRPDIVLMDVTMPGTDGIEAARALKQEQPEMRVIMLTVREESDLLFEAIKAGADGYLLKTIRAQQLVEMLRAAQRGEAAITPQLAARMVEEFRRLARLAPSAASADMEALNPLTARERQVLAMIAQGASDREIAQSLTVSLYTVKAHVRSLLQKLQVASRQEAARLARGRND